MKNLIFTGLILCASVTAQVRGWVLDALSGAPISAELTVASTNASWHSDASGHFAWLGESPTGSIARVAPAMAPAPRYFYNLLGQQQKTPLTPSNYAPRSYPPVALRSAAVVADTLVITAPNYAAQRVAFYPGDSLNIALIPQNNAISFPAQYWGLERFCHYEGVAETRHAGLLSPAALDLPNRTGSAFSLAIQLIQADTIDLWVSFANGGAQARKMDLQGENQTLAVYEFAPTTAWDQWRVEKQRFYLPAGSHILTFTSQTADGGPNIDWVGSTNAAHKRGACPAPETPPEPETPAVPEVSSTPTGFCMVNGTTTGGGNVSPTVVTTYAEFKAAVQDKNPRVVVISGTIRTTDGDGYGLQIASNKTIRGADKNATIYGGLEIRNNSNVILQNFTIQGTWPNPGPSDAISIRNSHHIWIDHLNIWNAEDGNLDITNSSSYITVSWNKFWYTDTKHKHRFNGLIGSGGGDHPEDWENLKVTYHHNWFADKVDQRMPRLMYGQAHVYNNYYTAAGNSYCVGVGSYGAILVENNYFKNVKDPHVFMYDVYMWMTVRGNIYDNTTGKKDSGKGGSRKVAGQDFNVVEFSQAPYTYHLDAAKDIPTIVSQGAGPQ